MTITPATRLYGVVGDPIAHSLSPLIQNRWIQEAGIDAVYVALHLQSREPAADFKALARAGFCGLNVTLPHKGAAFDAAVRTGPNAEHLGAANTLVREDDGGWTAHNTDVDGFELALEEAAGKRLAGKRIVLIGAGGAARAAALVIAAKGASLAIVNRTEARAVTLGEELAPAAEIWGMDALHRLAGEADAVINSASLGHAGQALPALPPGGGRPFLDMSYGKAAARTLAAASKAGWKTHDGLRMLVGQAAAAFRLWFGQSPDAESALAACRAVVAVRR
ncbi:MAG: shikimate dehydrogenase [Alphaproteobacteria bacterium]|nr:shikimate dehydrogenase [Alphaproteobacteria bacterium]